MYQIYGLKLLIWLFSFIFALVLAVCIYFMGGTEWWRPVSTALNVATALLFLLDQTPAFPRLCRLPIIKDRFPDIDGDWTGEIQSNWGQISARLPGENSSAPLMPKKIAVKVTARLLSVSLRLKSDDRYSESKTIFVKVSRDEVDKSVRLWYLYENETKLPEHTDSDRHFGGAYLDFSSDTTGSPELDGVYWTNRNWHKGLNTAGRITLRKV